MRQPTSGQPTPDRTPDGPPVLRAKNAGDLLALVPYRLGFHPAESLVVISVVGERRRLGFSVRVDLPLPEHVDLVADQVSSALDQNDTERVLLVAYTSDPDRAEPLVEEMLGRLDEQGTEILEALRADGARWYSYICDGPCCPAAGTAYDSSCHPLAAAAVLEGAVALPDRAALESSVAATTGITAVSMDEAAARAEQELLDRLEAGESPEQLRASLQRRMRSMVEDFLAEPCRLTDDEVARAAVWAQFVQVRDEAWTMMCRADAGRHLDLWRQILCRVPSPYEPAVGCLTAFAAWLHGDGALAGCALDRALAADPDYSMAQLIDDTLRRAIPPSRWDDLPDGIAG